MLISPEVRRCVAFVGYRKEGRERMAGTGFFTNIKIPNTPLSSMDFVTARHVIERIKEESVDDKVLIRTNEKTAGAIVTEVDSSLWEYSTDPTVDVAYINVGQMGELDHISYPMASIVNDAVIVREGIGPGDDVFVTGLFRNHIGQKRNLPIIRVGNIAAMPEEKVRTKSFDMDAYLIEARSIGGLSGSPVFVAPGPFILKDGKTEFRTGRMHYLLGLIHGHFDVPDSMVDSVDEDAGNSKVNVGIGIVVPATKILEALNNPIKATSREQEAKKWRDSQAGTPDFG